MIKVINTPINFGTKMSIATISRGIRIGMHVLIVIMLTMQYMDKRV